MEEDIEMLEKLLKDVKQTSSYDKISHYKALENLLTRYKQLEEWKKEKGCSIQEVYELFIPKSKVKEKIEELEEQRKKYYRKDLSKAQQDKSMKMWGAICYLQDLLREE